MANETYTEVASAIRSHFNTNWDTDDASVTWENTPQDLTGANPWVRFSIRFNDPLNNTIGANCVHVRGFIAVQVFTRYDVGTGGAENIAEAIRSMFEYQVIGGIQFYGTRIDHIGDSNRQLNHIESTWFQLVVNIPFETL